MAREGVPFMGIAALASLVSALLGLVLPALFFLLAVVFILYFFRDPERITPECEGCVISPADGVVVEVADNVNVPFFKDHYPPHFRCKKVGIFMNVFDVHVNRAPVRGKVLDVSWLAGSFMSADKGAASFENERCAMLVEDSYGRHVTVVQVAGLIARRIVCRAEKGDMLHPGTRYGMIRFGSRVDIYLPSKYVVSVKEGDRVIAGQSIIGAMNNEI